MKIINQLTKEAVMAEIGRKNRDNKAIPDLLYSVNKDEIYLYVSEWLDGKLGYWERYYE